MAKASRVLSIPQTNSSSLSRRNVLFASLAAAMLAATAGVAAAAAESDPLLASIQACMDLKRALYAAKDGAHAESLALALVNSYKEFAEAIPTTWEGVRAKPVFAEEVLDRTPDAFDEEKIRSTIAIAKKRLTRI
jgi:hypothetical protein